jgi:anaerobic magnesium-protoporphyrin IX monomethyl ester cyclase
MFGVTMPPLGLASLAGALIRNKHEAVLMDALANDLDAKETAEMIALSGAQAAAVTVCASPYYEFAVDLAKHLKTKDSGITLITGGHHATFLFPQMLTNGFDYVVLNEGEETFSELINTLDAGGDPSKVRGLAFAKNSRIIRTQPRPLIESLDSLPMPAFELYDRSSCEADIFGGGSHLITMETSRGCPYNCEFCSVTAMWGHRWRFKSVERVLQELELVKSLGYNWVFIVDDNFIVNSILNQRAHLFEKIKKRRLNLNFIVQIRADLAARKPGIIKSASEAGVRLAFLGMESGSDTVLRNMRKGMSTQTAIKGIQVLHSYGIITHGGFVLGAPYESRKEFTKTFQFADQLRMAGLDSAQFSIYTPLPGTAAFAKALKDNELLSLDWNLYDCLHPVVKTQIGPLWLFLRSGIGQASFFIKKWLSDMGAMAEPCYGGYSEVVRNITQFIGRNLSKYTKETFLVPLNALKIWHRLKKDKTISEDTRELLTQTATTALP